MDSELAVTIEPEDQPSVNALRLRYDEHVLYADHHIGRFLQYLQDRGWLDRSIVVISADHGESFEKGFVGHGGPFLYEPLIHVPLLIHLPGQKHQKSISTPAEQVDLLPTMLDLVGLDVSAEIEGESLVPLLNSKRNHGRVFSMNFQRNSIFADITHGTIALIEGNMKYIHYLDEERFGDELFDLGADPKETVNLIMTLKEVSSQMRSEIERKLSEINRKGALGRP
jgi:arylsulfatase A-like enzyme